jgi:hypothetical protein
MNRMLKGPSAFKLGIADAMFAPADFLEESIAWAAGVVNRRGHRRAPRASPRRGRRGGTPLRRGAQARRRQDRRLLPRAVPRDRARRGGPHLDPRGGFAAEDEALGDLLMGDELRAGLYAFDLVQKRAKRPAGAPDKALARPVTKVGIVGAGLMASQLALLFIRRLGCRSS